MARGRNALRNRWRARKRKRRRQKGGILPLAAFIPALIVRVYLYTDKTLGLKLRDLILIVRSSSEKGTDMARIPSIFTSHEEERAYRQNFWITAGSVVNILSPERRLYCGVDFMGPDHHVNVAQEVHNRFDLSKSTESGGGIRRVNNFFSELEDAIAVLDSNTLTVEEDFQCAKINTLKREGLEVL
ncbi:hypothetical protein pdam_00022900 [Pocillopora damicornis]|uniref:Uncharacterized protein n=1 Tax=Pocillopora damicornis TaxID=46731 RepID=A0A3M6UP91_POCDA|nr:hypothetical protein pdam_00022900 [Pocillopora damicornis]